MRREADGLTSQTKQRNGPHMHSFAEGLVSRRVVDRGARQVLGLLPLFSEFGGTDGVDLVALRRGEVDVSSGLPGLLKGETVTIYVGIHCTRPT